MKSAIMHPARFDANDIMTVSGVLPKVELGGFDDTTNLNGYLRIVGGASTALGASSGTMYNLLKNNGFSAVFGTTIGELGVKFYNGSTEHQLGEIAMYDGNGYSVGDTDHIYVWNKLTQRFEIDTEE